MAKIALIGAGSMVFTRRLCSDILMTPALADSTISLMDIDAARLKQAKEIVQSLVDRRGVKATIEASTDRRQAVTDADYVITTFQAGGLDAFKLDIEIPEKYGVGQCVGDTLGPGGVFRGLRTIPVLVELCQDMAKVAPGALLLNYVNPMAPNCWAVEAATGWPHVGLCHSVQGTSQMLARWIDIPYDEINFLCAGINHQAFFLEFRRGKQDVYPLIWQAIEDADIYGSEPVRIELMKHFGYFVTESSGHASEYSPYFRKNAAMIEEELTPKFTDEGDDWFDFGNTGGYYRHCLKRLAKFQSDYEEIKNEDPFSSRSHEYGSWIMEAVETNNPIRINGNVPNYDLIDNLPYGCCVEAPCMVDANGVQPVKIGLLPTQLAALNRTNINVQELVVEAALTGSTDAVHYAVTLDPLTAAVCTLPQIHDMVDEMLDAEQQWLPMF